MYAFKLTLEFKRLGVLNDNENYRTVAGLIALIMPNSCYLTMAKIDVIQIYS